MVINQCIVRGEGFEQRNYNDMAKQFSEQFFDCNNYIRFDNSYLLQNQRQNFIRCNKRNKGGNFTT